MMVSYPILLFAAFVVSGTLGQSCQRSTDCPRNHCCRDLSGTNLVNNLEGTYLNFLRPSTAGTCVSGKASHMALCDGHCSCSAGHECYRMVTGVCCAPYRCYTEAEAQADRDRWRCGFLPMRAAPGGRRRRSFFKYLCPELPPAVNPGGPSLQPGLPLSPEV